MPTAIALRSRPRWILPAAVALLAVHVVLAFAGIVGRSVTSDETGHLTAGYAYWHFNDYRLQPENGNLPQRWAALPLLIAPPTLDPSLKQDDWSASRVWNIAQTFLFETGNNTDFLLLSARCGMLFWSVAAGLLVFWWARTVWGDTAGLGALAFFVFCPTALAHGPLITSDMCAAFCLLAALATWWRLCLHVTVSRIGIAGLMTGIALVAKFSAVLLIPAYVVLGAIGLIVRKDQHFLVELRRMAGAFTAAAIVATIVVWAFFGFRYRAVDPSIAAFEHFYLPWETFFARRGFWSWITQCAQRLHLLPEAFLYGFSFVVYFSAERGAFLAGKFSSTGWWWFFPFACLVKSTVGELMLGGLLVTRAAGLLRKFRFWDVRKIAASSLVPLVVFGLVFGAVTLTSRLNIGQRHVLPLYLILFIFSGVAFARISPKALRLLAGLALTLSAAESLRNLGNPLAFFNQLAGGPSKGWQLLVDSSLDWGQDVSVLGRWVRQNRKPGEKVYVSAFGTADPEYEGIKGDLLSPYYSLGKPRRWFELQPGLYCVSATMLQDVYGIRPGPWTMELEKDFQHLTAEARINLGNGTWDRKIPEIGFHPEHHLWLLDRLRFARLCQYLKVRKPETVINYTQFVYRLSAEEIATFSNKPYSALAKLMESAAVGSR